jgi:hypothetical protein
LLPRSSRHLDSSNLDGSDTHLKTKRSRQKKVDDYPEDDIPKRKLKQPSVRPSSNAYGEGGLS